MMQNSPLSADPGNRLSNAGECSGRAQAFRPPSSKSLRCRWGVRIAPTRALFALIPGERLKSETAWRSEVNSNSRYRKTALRPRSLVAAENSLRQKLRPLREAKSDQA
jgi:hypothetical protein